MRHFHYIEQFDADIGQSLNSKKSAVLAPTKAAKRIRTKLARPIQIQKQVRSLGRYHQVNKRYSAKPIFEKAKKAVAMCKRISMLPIPKDKLPAFIHSHVHSSWVFGTETQGPNLKTIQKIRTSIVDAFDPSSHHMRSPFLVLSTLADPFLDPLAKWVRHVLVHFMTMCDSHPLQAQVLLREISNMNAPKSSACNGFRNVMSYILAQIHWKVHSPADCSFDTPNGIVFVAKLDIAQLNQVLSHTIRNFLLRKIPNRQDHGVVPDDRQIDIHLTRLLLDNSFAKDSLHQFVQPYLGLLPVNVDHAGNILRQILTGRIFTGARLKAAGLATSSTCPSCGNQEDHDHIFRFCTEYDNTRPTLDTLPYDLSWRTGIILAPIMHFEFPDFVVELGQDPSPPVVAHGIVFIDGSCFIHDWARVRAASSAVFIPNQLEWVMSLPGSFLTSQRAEIFALAMALYATTGPLIVASDCSNVVRMFAFLQQNSFEPIALKAAANKDLWSLVIELARHGDAPVLVFKVKAHVSHNDPQDQHLTFWNSKADLLAKKHAWRVFEQCSAGLLCPYQRGNCLASPHGFSSP